MKYLGIQFDLKNVPVLDPDFIPFGVWMDAYLQNAKMVNMTHGTFLKYSKLISHILKL